jgi:GNAT superfamily N-acetyltransferase
MSTDVDIRFADPSDRLELRKMQVHSFRTLGGPYYDNAVIEAFIVGVGTMDDALLDDGTFFAATMEGRIVGCGGWSARTPGYVLHMNGSRAAPGVQKATVRSIFVHPDFARRGIAKAIMAAIEAEIVTANFTSASLTATLSGVPLYRSLGYSSGDAVTLKLRDGLVFVGIGMTKPLAADDFRRAAA